MSQSSIRPIDVVLLEFREHNSTAEVAAELRDQVTLTDEEFEGQRARILAQRT